MQLNDRKINILKAIIKDYIDTAEPVVPELLQKNITWESVPLQ